MNYLAHALPFLSDPYMVAGTAVPDWLNVVDRRAKARSKHAAALLQEDDARVVSLARGIVQHHHDDRWFHQTPAFVELQLAFSQELRQQFQDDGFRPSFLGHILVELLLDAAVAEQHPKVLDEYYHGMASLDNRLIADTVGRLTPRDVSTLDAWLDRFCQERFLYDYAGNETLLMRLNMVMRRVTLPQIPDSICPWFEQARERVRRRQSELIDRTPINWSEWVTQTQGDTP